MILHIYDLPLQVWVCRMCDSECCWWRSGFAWILGIHI